MVVHVLEDNMAIPRPSLVARFSCKLGDLPPLRIPTRVLPVQECNDVVLVINHDVVGSEISMGKLNGVIGTQAFLQPNTTV